MSKRDAAVTVVIAFVFGLSVGVWFERNKWIKALPDSHVLIGYDRVPPKGRAE